MTRTHYMALSRALANVAPQVCRSMECLTCNALVAQHRRDVTAVADAIESTKPGGGFDRSRFISDAGGAVN